MGLCSIAWLMPRVRSQDNRTILRNLDETPLWGGYGHGRNPNPASSENQGPWVAEGTLSIIPNSPQAASPVAARDLASHCSIITAGKV
jgi:hypothetical protein